jgi:Flp pilus assembly protein CpaB
VRNRGLFGILIVIIGVLLLGLGALAVYQNIVAINNPPLPPAVLTQSVLVAASDLPFGHLLSEGDLRLTEFPIENLPSGALADEALVLGKILKEDLAEGELLLQVNLADPTNVQGDLGFILSNDHVLMAFPANDRMSALNIIKRGDLIDIYASINVTVSLDDPSTEDVDETVNELITFDTMQAQPVTALVAGVTEDGGTNAVAYLLALNPQDALALKNLLDQGAIFDIVLRNPGSQLIFRLDPVSVQYLIELYGLEIVLP